MNMKKMLSVLMVMALAVSMLAGCSTGGGEEEMGPVEITVWEQMDPAAQEVFDGIAEDFMAANPNITVTRSHYETEELRTSFQSAALAGQGPELVYGPNDNIGIFTVSGLLQPITNVVSDDFLAKLDENALTEVDGEYYLVPDINGNQIALLYNKDMVEKAPETWEELVAMAKPYQNIDPSNPDNSTYGFLYNEREPFWFVAFYGAYGGEVFDKDLNPTLDNEAMVKALQFVVDVKEKDGLGDVEMNYDIADSLFKQGKTAFILNGAWSWSGYKDEGINLGIAPYPKLPGGERGVPYSSPKGYMISKFMDEKKNDAVAKFLEFALNAENNAEYALANSQSPTNLEALKSDKITSDELMQASVSTIKSTTPMPVVPEMRAIWDAIRPELEAVVAGDITPEEAAANMQRRAEEGIATIKGE